MQYHMCSLDTCINFVVCCMRLYWSKVGWAASSSDSQDRGFTDAVEHEKYCQNHPTGLIPLDPPPFGRALRESMRQIAQQHETPMGWRKSDCDGIIGYVSHACQV